MNSVFSNHLGRDFARLSIPCVLNLLVFSVYTIVDGFFVSHFLGEKALAAVNLSTPLIYLLYALGIAMAVGSGVLISEALGKAGKLQSAGSKQLGNGGTVEASPSHGGMGDRPIGAKEADAIFSESFLFTALLGIFFSFLTLIFRKPVCSFLGKGASGLVWEYLGPLALFFPFVTLEYSLEFLVKINGAPRYSLFVIAGTCLFNIFGDWLLMGPFQMGLRGAALATGFSQFLAAALFFIKIMRNRQGSFRLNFSLLRERKLRPFRYLFLGAADGSMELCNAIRAWLYNTLLLRISGGDAVAAFAVLNYAGTLCFNVATGITQGMEPLVSYHSGAGHGKEIRTLLKIGSGAEAAAALFCWGGLTFFTPAICGLFLKTGGAAYLFALSSARCYALSFLFLGMNILISGYLTALQEAGKALIISLLRGLLIHGLLLLLFAELLPAAFFYAAALSELLTGAISFFFLQKKLRRKEYEY